MAHWLDTRRAPFVTLTFPAAYTYEELDAEFSHLEAYYRDVAANTTGPVALLVDVTAVVSSFARNRRRIAHSLQTVAPLLTGRAVGQAYVAPDPIARASLTVILWLRQSPWPVKLFATRPEADAWLAERFAEAGHPLSDDGAT